VGTFFSGKFDLYYGICSFGLLDLSEGKKRRKLTFFFFPDLEFIVNQILMSLCRVHSMTEKLAQFTDIRCCLVVGGLSTKV
jgi:hypothetical protein